jgi:hypothetical protein
MVAREIAAAETDLLIELVERAQIDVGERFLLDVPFALCLDVERVVRCDEQPAAAMRSPPRRAASPSNWKAV